MKGENLMGERILRFGDSGARGCVPGNSGRCSGARDGNSGLNA
jgi:hypothetical protein